MANEDSSYHMPLNLFWNTDFTNTIPDNAGQNIPLLSNAPIFAPPPPMSDRPSPGQGNMQNVQSTGPVTRSGGVSQDLLSNGRSSKVVDRKRRMHAKSRAGCVACKERRLKCDENKPSCNRCVRRKTTCEYVFVPLARKDRTSSYGATGNVTKIILSPSQIDALVNRDNSSGNGGPSTSSAQEKVELSIRLPRELNLQDLRLMHHYTTQTASTLIEHDGVDWKNIIPNLAFKNPSVMHAILTVAASHISQTNPEDTSLAPMAFEHGQHAHRLFRESVSKKMDANNVDVVAASISLLIIQNWASFDRNSEDFMNDGWIAFVTDAQNIIHKVSSLLHQSQFASLLQINWDFISLSVSSITEKLRMMIDNPPELLPGYDKAMYKESYYLLAMIEATRTKPQHKDLPRLISGYLGYYPELLVNAALRYEKVAMVLFAHWCAGILMIESRDWWWCKGRAKYMVERINEYVGPLWAEYMEWPMKATMGGDDVSDCIQDFSKVRLNSTPTEV